MIPTNHEIEVLKAGEGLDIWGDPSGDIVNQYKANLRTETKIVKNANGDEVTSNYTVLFIGYVDIKLIDKIRFTEANGEIIEKEPIQLKFMRDLDGEVGFTKAVL